MAPPHKYKAIKKLKDNVATRKGEAPNNNCIKGPYDNALDAGLKPPPLTPGKPLLLDTFMGCRGCPRICRNAM